MAALSAQKEAAPVKTEEVRKPETVEEKKKRLRREERRKLRVSFKADDDLVQVREFVHDPEEDFGHEDSQVRDVKDTRGEGQMLKMHKDLDVDDEEDYEPPEEIILPEWTTPQREFVTSSRLASFSDGGTAIDFSVVDEQELARFLTSRGGKCEIKSPEQAVQEQREQATLMVIYTSDSNIPPSPREPSDTFSGDTLMEESFGPPEDQTRVSSVLPQHANKAECVLTNCCQGKRSRILYTTKRTTSSRNPSCTRYRCPSSNNTNPEPGTSTASTASATAGGSSRSFCRIRVNLCSIRQLNFTASPSDPATASAPASTFI